MPVIEVRQVEKRYREGAGWLAVLKGVSLSVAAGECLAIVGPSGAGKSTLLHLIGGLDLPSAGSVVVEGQAWGRVSARQRARMRNETIGFVFQSYHLLPELTVWENTMLPMWMGGRWPSSSARRARALELLQQVGLEARLTHRPAELSGGEQQRVAIARALANRPRILLCDEPTGNLDTASGARVLALLQQVRQAAGSTLLIVTHDTALAEVAGRVVQMRDGQIVDPVVTMEGAAR